MRHKGGSKSKTRNNRLGEAHRHQTKNNSGNRAMLSVVELCNYRYRPSPATRSAFSLPNGAINSRTNEILCARIVWAPGNLQTSLHLLLATDDRPALNASDNVWSRVRIPAVSPTQTTYRMFSESLRRRCQMNIQYLECTNVQKSNE